MEKNKDQMKEVRIDEILEKEDIKLIHKYIKNNDWNSVRDYLHSIEEALLEKGVLPDYLFYAIQFQVTRIKWN